MQLEPPRHSVLTGRQLTARLSMAALLALLALAPGVPWAYARWAPMLGPRLMLGFGLEPGRLLVEAMLIAVCFLWSLHLRVAGLGALWSLVYAGLLAGSCVLSSARVANQSLPRWLEAIGCGLFVYALLWVIRMHEEESGLQALASAALVLSIGMLAKPAVLMVSILLSLLFFFEDRRVAGSVGRTFLLLFTPLLLCFSSLIVLSLLYYGNLVGLWWIGALGARPPVLEVRSGAPALWPVWIGLAVLLCRALAGRWARPDVGYVGLAVALPAMGTLKWIPGAVSRVDFAVMLVCGAAGLLAQDVPRSWTARLAALVVLTAALGCSLRK